MAVQFNDGISRDAVLGVGEDPGRGEKRGGLALRTVLRGIAGGLALGAKISTIELDKNRNLSRLFRHELDLTASANLCQLKTATKPQRHIPW